MALAPEVLILTNKLDISADLVVLRLQSACVPYARINVEDCPICSASVRFPNTEWAFEDPWHGAIDLSGVSAIWYRRPGMPLENEESLSAATRAHVAEQWKMFVLGLRALDGVIWMNDPIANYAAEAKILQLAAATKVGLRVPDTCVTNDIEMAKRVSQPLVAKCLGSALIEEPGASYFVYTSEVDLADAIPAEIKVAPIIFQKRLLPKADYRVTIVGSHVFVAKIPIGHARPLDWRASEQQPGFEPTTIPEDVEHKLLSLLRVLNLRFGAIDICEADGGFFFLEVNPNGEWGWLETTVGLPISAAIAGELCKSSGQLPEE